MFPRHCSTIFFVALAIALGSLVAAVPLRAQQDANTLKLNQIQVIGSHNSYHAGIAANEVKVWQTQNPDGFKGLDYRHQPLAQQFDSGVRQIELDVYSDSKGGLYAHPNGPKMVAAAHLPADPNFDPDGVMSQPGFKVLHMQDVDYRSVCQPFTTCLKQIRAWSHAHPRHIPLFILVETKEERPRAPFQIVVPEPFTSGTFDALDAEIRSVFPANELITPDDVRGSYDTLNRAVLAGNWPTLASARGKVIFLMDQRPMGPIYLEGHPSLRGRVLFTNAESGQPDAAFIERNDGPVDDITALVRQGYLIRTRTDDSTREARNNDTARRDAVMASGAQMLSTDYPANEPASWPGHYVVTLPGKAVARGNPVNAPAAYSGKPLQ
ncbi:MAG: phosphatidylinositol-specific phospholipase C1-like protein [Terracidiphilus sp.]|nr:phosphatidylinositol-specific phospholipase C1-like protein [Terracidiphilus sp.]